VWGWHLPPGADARGVKSAMGEDSPGVMLLETVGWADIGTERMLDGGRQKVGRRRRWDEGAPGEKGLRPFSPGTCCDSRV
jgi:hypothetical protein